MNQSQQHWATFIVYLLSQEEHKSVALQYCTLVDEQQGVQSSNGCVLTTQAQSQWE